jgi:hypothetical protein
MHHLFKKYDKINVNFAAEAFHKALSDLQAYFKFKAAHPDYPNFKPVMMNLRKRKYQT